MKQDWNADDYARHSAVQQLWAQELIAKLCVHGSESLLDIGCGDGKITARIALIIPKGKVLGIDQSPNMIRLGLSQNGRLLTISHTEEKDTIRIISARKADKGEQELYEEG